MYKGVISHSNNNFESRVGKNKLLLTAQKDRSSTGNSHIRFFHEFIKVKCLDNWIKYNYFLQNLSLLGSYFLVKLCLNIRLFYFLLIGMEKNFFAKHTPKYTKATSTSNKNSKKHIYNLTYTSIINIHSHKFNIDL